MDKILGSIIGMFLTLFFVLGLVGSVLTSVTYYVDPEILIFLCIGLPTLTGILLLVLFSLFTLSKTYRVIVRSKLIEPDPNGLYPINLTTYNTPYTDQLIELANHHQHSKKVSVPQSFNYSPRFSTRNDNTVTHDENVSRETLMVPSFASLPFVTDKILLGYEEENTPFYIPRNTMISTLVGGVSGSGKSTLMRLILSQYLATGSKLSIIDPHYGSGDESLASSFVGLPDSLYTSVVSQDDKEILDVLGLYCDQIHNRLTGKDTDRTPLILVIDEFVALLGRKGIRENVIGTVHKISSEARKVNIFTFCISQQFHKDFLPTTLRNSFSGTISTKTRYDTALVLSGSATFAREVDKIHGYQCVYSDVTGNLKRLNVPNCTQKDLLEKHSNYTGKSHFHTVSDNEELGHFRPLDGTGFSEFGTGAETTTAKEKHVLAALKLGKTIPEIIREVYGIEGKGRAYMNASDQIYQIISTNIKV